AGGRRAPRGGPAADLDALRRLPRLQPDGAPARGARPRPAAGVARGHPDRPRLLPPADLGAVPHRAARRVRLRDRGVARGGRRVVAARRAAALASRRPGRGRGAAEPGPVLTDRPGPEPPAPRGVPAARLG